MWYSRRILKAVCGGLVLCLLLSIGTVYSQAAEVREAVVRLHILAHSDSTADQTLKLQVRDAVVTVAAGWLDGADTPDEARTLAQEQLPHLQAVAEQTVRDAGSDYPVTVELTRMYFTTRQYDTVTLPAGMYDAVRITIGDGAGQNWWCVVYPPLCVGSATDRRSMAQTLDSQQPFLVQETEGYVMRFKVLEWIESFLQIFR